MARFHFGRKNNLPQQKQLSFPGRRTGNTSWFVRSEGNHFKGLKDHETNQTTPSHAALIQRTGSADFNQEGRRGSVSVPHLLNKKSFKATEMKS